MLVIDYNNIGIGSAIFVNPGSNQGCAMLLKYKNSNKTLLTDAYKKPSSNKNRAYKRCREMMSESHGEDFKITGSNCHTFSAAFVFLDEGRKMLCYITRDHTYVVPYVRICR